MIEVRAKNMKNMKTETSTDISCHKFKLFWSIEKKRLVFDAWILFAPTNVTAKAFIPNPFAACGIYEYDQ